MHSTFNSQSIST